MEDIDIRKTKKKFIEKKIVSFSIETTIAEEFKKLAKQKGFFQQVLLQDAIIMLIEKMKKMEDKK